MSILYLSYSDGMARYHLQEINKTINRNPQLLDMMDNRSPKADYSFRYHVNKKPVEIMHGGLFSFKRGMHVNGALRSLLTDNICCFCLSSFIKVRLSEYTYSSKI